MIIRLALQLEIDTKTHTATVLTGTVEKNPNPNTTYCPGPCGGKRLFGGRRHCSITCKNIMRDKRLAMERLLIAYEATQGQLESERASHETTIQEGQ